MTEEKKDVIEIKKDSLKQFFVVVGASFVGCFLAILLAGQLLKPKAPCFCPHRIMTPPPCAMMFDAPHHKKFDKHRLPMGDFERGVKPPHKIQDIKKPPMPPKEIKKVEQK